MNFKQEIYGHYYDQDGLVTVDRDPTKWSTGNGILFLSIFMTILKLREELHTEDQINFIEAITACEAPGQRFGIGSPIAGLYDRNPDRYDKQAHDDYIGISTASLLLGNTLAKNITYFGRAYNWHFNNQNLGDKSLSSWHGRFPGLVSHYKMCANEHSFWDKVKISGVIQSETCFSKQSPSGMILSWLRVQAAKHQNVAPRACKSFEDALNKNGSINYYFKEYFGSKHPFTGSL